MVSLRGKTALITGVTRRAGIGAAIAQRFAEAGATIATGYYRPYDQKSSWGVTPAEPEQILERIRQTGRRAAGFEVDLATAEGPAQLLARTTAALGPVHILVNNATYSTNMDLETLDAAELDKHYAVNVRANALLSSLFAQQFPAGRGGRIINLTSGQGLGPMPDELAYAATKAAVEAFTVSLSPTLARRGITINAVDPGATDTGWMTPELKQQLEEVAPMGRVGIPDDAARLITFLASAEAEWITGQIIRSRGAT